VPKKYMQQEQQLTSDALLAMAKFCHCCSEIDCNNNKQEGKLLTNIKVARAMPCCPTDLLSKRIRIVSALKKCLPATGRVNLGAAIVTPSMPLLFALL